MQGVRATVGVLHVVLTTKLAVRGELHPTVVEEAVWFDLGVILLTEIKTKNPFFSPSLSTLHRQYTTPFLFPQLYFYSRLSLSLSLLP